MGTLQYEQKRYDEAFSYLQKIDFSGDATNETIVKARALILKIFIQQEEKEKAEAFFQRMKSLYSQRLHELEVFLNIADTYHLKD